jgi:hypothetical protein
VTKARTGEAHLAAPAVGSGNARGGIEVCAQLDLGVISMYSGNGAPGPLVNGLPPEVGDLYWRGDGGVGSTLYRCTAVGPPPTWAASAAP